MERFSKSEYEFCANLLKDGILKYDLNDIIKHLNEILRKCCQNTDNTIDSVFKSFILKSDIDCVYGLLCGNTQIKDRNTIIDIITFKQSSDIDITILAKIMYRKYGKFYHDWLDWQIRRLLDCYSINLKEEYISYRISIGKDYNSIPGIFDKEF